MIVKSILIPTVIGVLLAAGAARAQQVNVEQIVAQKVQPILPENGKGGGVAVAVRMNGTTSFFNYGFANNAQNRRVTRTRSLILARSEKCSRPRCLHKQLNRA